MEGVEVVDYRKRARKLPMKKREDKASRMCTFTKRRGGLFKKATDLHLLTGAQIAVVVFSEAGRPYFHGSTEAIDRFLAQEASTDQTLVGRSSPNPDDAVLAGPSTHESVVEDLESRGDRLLREIEDDPCMRWILQPRL